MLGKQSMELDSEFVSFYTAAALPGTKLYYYVRDHKLDDFSDKNIYKESYYFPNFETHYMSKDKVLELHKFAMKKYYLRPSYIIKRLLSIRSFAELKNYFFAGVALMLKK